MPDAWSDEYCDYHYQWQSWNREERIYNPHDKKNQPIQSSPKEDRVPSL